MPTQLGGDGRPWFHERAGPALWNEWTWTHAAWGVAAWKVTGSWVVGLTAHTLYEMVEGELFPREDRDVSMLNHLGDTLAFAAGMWLGEYISGRRPDS